MPLQITCSCGKSLRAPDEFAGRRVKCPSCGVSQTLPERAKVSSRAVAAPAGVRASGSPPPSVNVVRFTCSCGKKMQAMAEYAGRLVRCPDCGDNVIVAAADTDSDPRVRPSPSDQARRKAPALDPDDIPEVEAVEEVEEAEDERSGPRRKRKAARPSDDDFDDDDDDDDDDDRPRNRKNRRKPQKSGGRILLWLSLATLLLILLGGGSALAWLFLSKGAADDLAFVPGDAQGFISFRPAEITATPFWQTAVNQLPPVLRGGNPPVPLNEVERATVVFFDADPAAIDQAYYQVILSTKSLEKKDIFRRLGDDYQLRKEGTKSYYVPSLPMNPSLWFAGDKILIAGKGAALQRAMNLPSVRTPGPLDEALADLEADHHIVAAFSPPAGAAERARASMPPMLKQYQVLSETTFVTLIGDLSTGLALDVSLEYASDAKAAEAKAAAEKGKSQIALLTAAMGGGKQTKGAANAKDAPNPLTTFLNGLRIEQSGPTVSIRTTIDGDLLASLGPLMNGAAFGAGGPNAKAMAPGGKRGSPQVPPTTAAPATSQRGTGRPGRNGQP